MSIATQIQRLTNAKASIKASLEAKGATVPSSTTLDGYAAIIDNLPTGGGGLTYVATTATSLTPEWDKLYQWTNNPTTITINAPTSPVNSTKETILRFTAGSTAPTISIPASFKWYGGSSVTFSANKTYEIALGYDMKAEAVIIVVSEYTLTS